MDRPRAAEGDDGDPAKVHAHLNTVHRCGCGHVLVHNVMDPGRCVDHAERQFFGHGSGGRVGQRCVEGHVTAEEGAGIEQAEDHVGVGHCRDRPALGVACGSGISPGRLGTDLQQAELIHASQAAASGPDLDEVHRRNRHGIAGSLLETVGAGHLESVGQLRLTVFDEAGLCGRAAHVEAQQPFDAEPFGEPASCERTCRRAGFD